ncbi:MAG: CPBP family intramembrane glutamic endopeptidase [Lysobacteraceae bacterium]
MPSHSGTTGQKDHSVKLRQHSDVIMSPSRFSLFLVALFVAIFYSPLMDKLQDTADIFSTSKIRIDLIAKNGQQTSAFPQQNFIEGHCRQASSINGYHCLVDTEGGPVSAKEIIDALDGSLYEYKVYRPRNYVATIPEGDTLIASLVFFSLIVLICLIAGWRPLKTEEFRALFLWKNGLVIYLIFAPNIIKMLLEIFSSEIGVLSIQQLIRDGVKIEFGLPKNLAYIRAAYTVIAAPLLEEFVYRVLVIHTARQWMHPVLAVVLSSLFFTMVHQHELASKFFIMFLTSLSIGYLWVVTKSVSLCVLSHAIINLPGAIKMAAIN